MTSLRIRFPRILVAALAVVSAVSAAPAFAADKVTVGMIGSVGDAPIFIAQDKGFFAKAGIAPVLEPLGTMTRMIAPLGSGQLDVGFGAISAGLYNAVGREITMRIVADKGRNAPGYGYNAILVRKDLVDSGAVKTLADLKGRKIATIGTGTIDASVLDQAMRSVNLIYDDITQTALTLPNHLVAHKNGAIDATLTPEPFATIITDSGLAVKLATVDQFYPNQQQAVTVYSGEVIAKRRDVAQRFMNAYLQGVRFYMDALKNGSLSGPGADEVIASIVKNSQTKDAGLLKRFTPPVIDPNGRLSTESMEKDWRFLKGTGLIEGNVMPKDLIDMSFADAAVKTLGPYKAPQ